SPLSTLFPSRLPPRLPRTARRGHGACAPSSTRSGPALPAAKRARVLAYLTGLLSPLKRKNSWQLAEQAGDPAPYALQHLLDRAKWEADAVRDDLQAYVRTHLADPE